MLEDASTQRFEGGVLGPQRWLRLKNIFHAALPLGEEERGAFLEEACAGDEGLRREAESLLAASKDSGDFLSEPASALAVEVLVNAGSDGAHDSDEPAASGNLRPGMMLGDRYEIEKELGYGSIGVVYLARDRRTKKLVAVKLLLEQSLRSELAVRMFKQEAEALARLGEHPGIVGVSDVGRLAGGESYFVMQYVEGITLREALNAQSKGLYLERAANILEQAAEALDTAHSHGILHRDLKPENIMLQRLREGREHVKIIDFGVAKVRDSEVAKNTADPLFVGTPRYMSPEQLRSEQPTAASDIYALGVILYEALMGRHPFEDCESSEQLLEQQKSGPPVQPSAWRKGVSEEADRVIRKALAYDAEARYQSARKFSDDLAWALFKTRPGGWKSSYKTWGVAAAILVAVIIGAVLWAVPSLMNIWPGGVTQTQQSGTAEAEARRRNLTFGLITTRQRDGKSTRATGREMFDTGDGFKFELNAGAPGALYIFNQGTSENWHVLFPTCENNHLDARITPERSVKTEENVFTNRSGQEKGTEKVWIVWASGSVGALDELVKQSARGCPTPCDGCLTISDSTQKEFLSRFMREHATPRPEVKDDKERWLTTLEGQGEILVHSLELEHKDWK